MTFSLYLNLLLLGFSFLFLQGQRKILNFSDLVHKAQEDLMTHNSSSLAKTCKHLKRTPLCRLTLKIQKGANLVDLCQQPELISKRHMRYYYIEQRCPFFSQALNWQARLFF